ncbi:MAG: glycosyltransferase [Breznakia sp.]
MEKLYLVFDQLPDSSWSGLFVMYQHAVLLLKDEYDIELISIFNVKKIEEVFKEHKLHVIRKSKINIRFHRLFMNNKNKKGVSILFNIYSMAYYFFSIPFARRKVHNLVGNDKVIASAPSSAIFISKKNKFILEIHTKFDYFWNGNIMAKLQIQMMRKPTLTLFRTQADAHKANKIMRADYMYNFINKAGIKPNFNIEKKVNKLLFVGRLEKEKNLFRMLEIMQKLKEEKPDIRLDIYGEGSLYDELQERIQKWDLAETVYLMGYTSNKNIYANYKLCLITSVYEGFPLCIIEAKANGIPAVSSHWGGGVSEVIHEGVDGYIVEENCDMEKRILHLLNNDSVLEYMSRNAYQDFERFSETEAKKRWKFFLNTYKKTEE